MIVKYLFIFYLTGWTLLSSLLRKTEENQDNIEVDEEGSQTFPIFVLYVIVAISINLNDSIKYQYMG